MIRLASDSDCSNLAILATLVWINTYAKEGIKQAYSEFVLTQFTPDYFRSLLANDRYRLWVCEENDILQGFALINLDSAIPTACLSSDYAHLSANDCGFEVEKLYVDSRHQGKGIGKRLLQAIEQSLKQPYWLDTWVENDANGFYQYLGLASVGIRSFDFSGHRIDNNLYVRFAD
jgi:GNAT superfamily N-acetyltransferase